MRPLSERLCARTSIRELDEVLLGIGVAGLGIHRAQISSTRSTRTPVRSRPAGSWPTGGVVGGVGCFAGHEVHVALEACTGWYFVVPGARARRRSPPPRRGRPDARAAGAKAPRQDRPRPRALAADAALAGQVSRGLDPGRPHRLAAHASRLRKARRRSASSAPCSHRGRAPRGIACGRGLVRLSEVNVPGRSDCPSSARRKPPTTTLRKARGMVLLHGKRDLVATAACARATRIDVVLAPSRR
jgi:hypothetical protein